MRKSIILTVVATMLLLGGGLFAQPYNVTFQVDMSVWVMEGKFDTLRQDVRITGDLVDPNWDPAQAPILTDADGDYVFTTTLELNSGDYQYKYLVGSEWGKDELQGQDNRSLTVGSSDMTVDKVYFDNQEMVDFPEAPAGMVNVLLSVDMSRQVQLANFDPAADTVRVTGDLVDPTWDPATAPILEDPDSNKVYVKMLQVDDSSDYQYKYLIGSAWGNDELQGQDNRMLSVTDNDTALFPVYFDNDPYVVPVGGDSVNVTLQVDMSVQIQEGQFDPASDVVRTAGSFQGWAPEVSPDMEDPDEDSIYVQTYKMTVNTEHQYKFLIGTTWGQDEANNRTLDVGEEDLVVDPVYFNDDSVVTTYSDGQVTFTVKMDVMDEIGIFDPAVDSLQIRGSFNGWSDSETEKSIMEQNFLDANEWFIDVAFESEGVGNNLFHKYFVNLEDEESMWADGYERPLSQGGGNRDAMFEGVMDQEVGPVYYDDVHPDWVVEDGVNVEVVFYVDMKPAMDGTKQAIPFDPEADSLFWINEQPSFTFSQGWEDTDNMKVLQLTDEDSDSIYTGTLTLNTPSFNAFEYRYAYIHGGEWIHEPAGFGDFAYRVRYVGQDEARSFPEIPWHMPMDVWTNDEDKSDAQEVDPFESYTDIEDVSVETPQNFALHQNYPNPFNPETKIRYTLPVRSQVNIAIYNVLGQKVRTLVDDRATAGTHVTTWNGRDDLGNKVATGVYFYKIEANDFTSVKKMVLMK
ncbi:MAG: T9SS type A sorting domain-containing protein [Caldithrix sp.]|nr:T9SS type A sorting domain-containing protein [Caldithrix sp.]